MVKTWSLGQDFSRRTALTRLGAGGLGVALASRAFATSAQDATPTVSTGGHPIVGTWIADTDESDPSNLPSLFLFNSDGSYVQSDAGGGNGFGAWSATGANTANLTIYFQEAENGNFVGTLKVRASITVADDGQSFNAPYTLEYVSPDGQASGEYGPSTATGIKITVEPMGTPKGPTSDLESSLNGTPQATPTS